MHTELYKSPLPRWIELTGRIFRPSHAFRLYEAVPISKRVGKKYAYVAWKRSPRARIRVAYCSSGKVCKTRATVCFENVDYFRFPMDYELV